MDLFASPKASFVSVSGGTTLNFCLRYLIELRRNFRKAFPHDSGEGVAEGRRMRVDICTRTIHQISVICTLQNRSDIQPFHRPDKEHQTLHLAKRGGGANRLSFGIGFLYIRTAVPRPFVVPEIEDFYHGTLIRSLHPPPAAFPHSHPINFVDRGGTFVPHICTRTI